MRNFLANTMLSAILAGTAFGFAPVASAQDIQLELGREGPKVRLLDRCDPRVDDCRTDRDRRDGGDRFGRDSGDYGDRDRDYRRDRRAERVCTEDRALDKAERMGIRRASIQSAGRRSIEVRGRSRGGERITVAFGRAPNCPILSRM